MFHCQFEELYDDSIITAFYNTTIIDKRELVVLLYLGFTVTNAFVGLDNFKDFLNALDMPLLKCPGQQRPEKRGGGRQ